jgi:flagellar basal body-associated protein FliL
MKRILKPRFRGLLIASRVMFVLVLLLAGVIIGGSVYAALRAPGSAPLFRIGGASGAESGAGGGSPVRAVDAAGGVSVFTGIGRLRVPVAGGGSTLILSIAFPYPPGDQPFTEELASRITNFRTIAVDYFSSLPAGQIAALNEEAAKTEILRRYNAMLRLGKIEALYFNDLMVVD